MLDNKPLTSTQRKILNLLREHGSAAFQGQRGRRGFDRELRSWKGESGLVIEAYQTPEYFLVNRGLLQRVPSNAQGHWYRLTKHGQQRANRLGDLK